MNFLRKADDLMIHWMQEAYLWLFDRSGLDFGGLNLSAREQGMDDH